MGRTPNAEQRAIVEASKRARLLSVIALAGTGKTSTLEMIAEANPYVRYLYVAFNRAIKDEAQARFPKNVTCVTGHGMVFRQYGQRYSAKLNGPRVPASRAASILGLKELRVEYCVTCNRPTQTAYDWAASEVDAGRGSDWHAKNPGRDFDDHSGHAVMAGHVNRNALASLVMRTVDRWCQSAEDEISWWHCPKVVGEDDRLQPLIRAAVVPHALEAWDDLKSARGQLKFSHDMYLKMAQMDGWKPSQLAIMLDEAQDTSPVLANILLEGTAGKRKIVVGDPNQAIYEWRGAIDAMASFQAEQTLALTGSYRFGPPVADEANKWLRDLECSQELKGWKKKEEVTGRRTWVSADLEPGEMPDAVITRSNGGAIAAVMSWLEAGKRVAVVGGGREIESLARAASTLMAGGRSDHPDLVNFESWGAVQTYCKEEAEAAGTLVPLVKAIDTYQPEGILRMCKKLVPEDVADVTISTQHKSKGREWGVVQIGNDSKVLDNPDKEPSKEELRLAYVAITRAKDHLVLGSLNRERCTA